MLSGRAPARTRMQESCQRFVLRHETSHFATSVKSVSDFLQEWKKRDAPGPARGVQRGVPGGRG